MLLITSIAKVSDISALLDAARNEGALESLWTDVHDKSFAKLKTALTENTPDLNQPSYVETDASNYGIGAV